MSLEKLKAKLEAIKAAQTNQSSSGTSSTDGLIWKPQPGKQIIRILPNKFTEPGYPFVELYFYYDFGKTWVSPSSFGEFDPIINYCNSLLDGKKVDKEEFKRIKALERKLLPKVRYYVPILVRGDEATGVKFWGFGVQNFQRLGDIFTDDDYGDISELKTGRDITVEYIPATKDGEFPKTNILVKPNQTPATEDAEVYEKVKAMVDISKNFTKPTEDELKNALTKYLDIPSKENSETETVSVKSNGLNVTVNHDATNEGFDIEIKGKTKPEGLDDIEAAFDDILNGKK